MERSKTAIITLLSSMLILALIATEPVTAQESATETIEQIDFMAILRRLVRFLANILESAAEIMRMGLENLNEGYNSTQQ